MSLCLTRRLCSATRIRFSLLRSIRLLAKLLTHFCQSLGLSFHGRLIRSFNCLFKLLQGRLNATFFARIQTAAVLFQSFLRGMRQSICSISSGD